MNSKFSKFSIILTASLLSLGTTSFGIINHLPSALGAPANESHVERQLHSLNRVIATELSGVAEFPYWKHIGTVGMGSGIYLGEGSVLTSAHVGCHPFVMEDGSRFQPDYASWRILQNADGTRSDLALFRVRFDQSSALAKLGSLPVSSAHPQPSSPVLLVGNGFTQGKQPMTVSSGGKVLGVLGYRVEPQRGMAWCLNRTSQALDSSVETGKDFSTRCFTTQFDRTHFAGQAADGDSGGGAFSYNRTQKRWELSGCIIAVSSQRLSVTFGSRTFLGDLDSYASQIPGSHRAISEPVIAVTVATPKAPAIQAQPIAIGAAR